MRLISVSLRLAATLVAFAAAAPTFAQVLYSQNFDVTGQDALWTVSSGPQTPDPVTEAHDFFFDYSTKGIPSAPNSGGTTRGMMLAANLFDPGVFGGVSASPNDQSFTGDYSVSFDVWANYVGATTGGVNPIGTTSGSTMLSTYGIMTSGTFPNRAGSADGVFFAATGDTSSSAFRAYSSERQVSYQVPFNTDIDANGEPDSMDDLGQPIDSHATHHAGNRSNNPNSVAAPASPLYLSTFPSVTVPAAQTALYPDTQFGQTQAGAVGFAWHEVEIAKIANLITWKMDGVLLITIDTTNFVGGLPAGTNIHFGHADVNTGIGTGPNYADVSFTIIDNIVVESATAVIDDANFDNDADVDGDDFLTWQRNTGISDGSATNATGDANGNGNVDMADFAIWQTQFGTTGLAGAAASSVPEPANWCSAAVAALILVIARSPGRQLAFQSNRAH